MKVYKIQFYYWTDERDYRVMKAHSVFEALALCYAENDSLRDWEKHGHGFRIEIALNW